MDCRYCKAWNAEEEVRCQKCGRRQQESRGPVAVHAQTYSHGATAAAVRMQPIAQPVDDVTPKQRVAVNYQQPLFGSREFPRVVPFESISPEMPTAVVKTRTRPTAPRPRVKKTLPGQQTLDFTMPEIEDAPPGTSIYCDAPVATASRRVLASALDGLIVVFGSALFAATVYFGAGPMALDRTTIVLLAGAVGIFALLYKLLWCLGGGDSPGMLKAGLRLVDFDGRTPTRSQRISRAASAILSLAAAGLGLLWALADEERLTWHDQISKTFPTPF